MYTLKYTSVARRDMDNLYFYILDEIKMPQTAVRYFNGILDTIEKLTYLGNFIGICPIQSIQKIYGPYARTVTYKKMTIIYNVIEDIILIRRIIAGSMIL
jgi:plasmid stabilization system protein ParE